MNDYAAYRLGWQDGHSCASAMLTLEEFETYCKGLENLDSQLNSAAAFDALPDHHTFLVRWGEYFAVERPGVPWGDKINVHRRDDDIITDVEIPDDVGVFWWDGSEWTK